jgi:translation initiation factor 1
MNKKFKNLNFYSTNPDFKYDDDLEETISKDKQNLEVWIDKHRAGKTAVIIKGFIGNNNDLKSLSKMLKTKCGVGGSAKKGEIIIQGDVRDKIMNILKKEGYNFKRVGG